MAAATIASRFAVGRGCRSQTICPPTRSQTIGVCCAPTGAVACRSGKRNRFRTAFRQLWCCRAALVYWVGVAAQVGAGWGLGSGGAGASTAFSAALAASRTTAAAAYTVSGSGFLHGVYGGFCGFLDGFDGFAGGCGGFEKGFEGGLCGFLGVVHLAFHCFLPFSRRGAALFSTSSLSDLIGRAAG